MKPIIATLCLVSLSAFAHDDHSHVKCITGADAGEVQTQLNSFLAGHGHAKTSEDKHDIPHHLTAQGLSTAASNGTFTACVLYKHTH